LAQAYAFGGNIVPSLQNQRSCLKGPRSRVFISSIHCRYSGLFLAEPVELPDEAELVADIQVPRANKIINKRTFIDYSMKKDD
jgi:hypothetical protein